MLTYEECKRIAVNRAKGYDLTINKAYKLNGAYVFDSNVELMGILPIVVDTEGNTKGIWAYINEHDLTMDDMEEIEV